MPRKGKPQTPEQRTMALLFGACYRCHNKTSPAYDRYGGRGITVCDRWREFREGGHNFVMDMGLRPSPQHTLDRIDNDGPYSPKNCRWATRVEQARNRRSNHLITAFGKTQSLVAWADETGIGSPTIRRRLKRGGMDPEKALSVQVKFRFKWFKYKGERYTLSELCNLLGLPYGTINARLAAGWGPKKAIFTPVKRRES